MDFKYDLNVPRNPNLSVQPVITPDNGFLYCSFKMVLYIAPKNKSATEKTTNITTFHNYSDEIIGIACDPNWSNCREFAILDNSSLNVWDMDLKVAVRGHKVHKSTGGIEKSLCYVKHKQILSVDNSATVLYCVSSNTYKLYETLNVFKTKLITILKVAPFDDNLVAAANKSGLIVIISLKTMSPVTKFRGHDFELCSLEWMPVLNVATNDRIIPVEKKEKGNATPAKEKGRAPLMPAENDDIFDIYSFDHLENEFGGYQDKKPTLTDEEEAQVNRMNELKSSHPNFDFLEACDNLKELILSEENNSNDSTLGSVVLDTAECDIAAALQDAQELTEAGALNNENGTEFPNAECDILNQSDKAENNLPQILASVTKEGLIWLWDVKNNRALEKVTCTTDKKKETMVYKFFDINWISSGKMYVCHNSHIVEYSVNVNSKKSKIKMQKKFYLTQNMTVFRLGRALQGNTFWGLSSKQITCFELEESNNEVNQKVVKQYDTMSSKTYMIKQSPSDPNLLAIACSDKRIALWNTSILEEDKFILSAYFTQKVQSSVQCIDWHMQNEHLIAFATREGRVGVLNTSRYSNTPTIFTPVTNGVVYVIKWATLTLDNAKKDVLFVCANNKLYYYKLSNSDSDAVEVPDLPNVSSVHSNEIYLFVGTRDGNVHILDLENNLSKIWSTNISKIYISKFDYYNNELAVSSEGGEIAIIDLKDTNDFKVKILRGHEKGVNSVCWSKKNAKLLVSASHDRKIKVWDTEAAVCIATCALDCSLFYAIFSPFHEDIIMVAGDSITLRFINYKEEQSDKVAQAGKNDSNYQLAQMNTAFRPISKSASRKNRKVNKMKGINADDLEGTASQIDEIEEIVQELESVCLNKKTNKLESKLANSTILYLTNKELNSEPMECLKNLLNIDENNDKQYQYKKLFMNNASVKDLLRIELKNHKSSKTDSVGNIIIPQLTTELKEEILNKIETKSLTSVHVSVAPTISYDFWKTCCTAYALQLIGNNDILNAIPYFIAIHDINSALDSLLECHYYREAWVIAKIRKLDEDPIFEKISSKWANYLDSCGNFESAALIWACVENYQQAMESLGKRKQSSEDIQLIMKELAEKIAVSK